MAGIIKRDHQNIIPMINIITTILKDALNRKSIINTIRKSHFITKKALRPIEGSFQTLERLSTEKMT